MFLVGAAVAPPGGAREQQRGAVPARKPNHRQRRSSSRRPAARCCSHRAVRGRCPTAPRQPADLRRVSAGRLAIFNVAPVRRRCPLHVRALRAHVGWSMWEAAKAAAADATISGDGHIVRHLAEREYALAWANDPTRTTRHTQPNPNSQTSPPASPPPAHPIHFPAAAPGPPTQFNPPVAAHSLGIG